MKNYNSYLSELRKSKHLSLKEAAKGIGINRWMLYFYENGYFRPSKKNLDKIERFYQVKVSLEGMDAYPSPLKEKELSAEKENLKAKRIVFGSLSGVLLLAVITGIILFNKSVNNTQSYYGETYNEIHDQAFEEGDFGYDVATSMKYYVINEQGLNDSTAFVFYETNNILYFNECTYSITSTNSIFDINRYHYQFGSNLAVSSYVCNFTYGNFFGGTFFTCSFEYKGGEAESIDNFKIITKGELEIDEKKAVDLVNTHIKDMEYAFSDLLSEHLSKNVAFYEDFLPAREKGRTVNSSLQISALLLIFPGTIAFYIIFSIFVRLMVKNIKPRLVSTSPHDIDNKHEELPKDWTIRVGIPDMFLVILGKIMQFGSIIFLIIAFIAKLGVPFLSFFAHPFMLPFFRYSLLGGIFLEHFIMINRIKKPTTLFYEIIYNLGFFLFIATMESIVITLTNAWGYDFASLIYKYIPGNVYQVVAVHYLIFLFLFFQPPFLNKRKKIVRIIWHSLSFIPLGFLIATYFLSNSYSLVYGVKENIFINFWFPNGFLSLSIVCVLFLYASFAIRLYYERRYGKHNAQLFFYGDRYSTIENIICAGLIVIAGLIDLVFINNQYAYYLGLGGNYWMFFLVPLIVLCKYSPNNQQIFLISNELSAFNRESKTAE